MRTIRKIQRGTIREMKSSVGVQLGKFTFAHGRMLGWEALEWQKYRGKGKYVA